MLTEQILGVVIADAHAHIVDAAPGAAAYLPAAG